MTISQNNKKITQIRKYISSLRERNSSESIPDVDIEMNNQSISDAYEQISEIEEDTRQRRINLRDQINRNLETDNKPTPWEDR
ncbi:hypothetical protein [Gluconobacter sp. P5B12]|uniref:hypothetical protein n=1 Tax=unclassified Gluconobacter TaxID=2644261 RepID=UPI001C055BF3|nr:hypothetical protein [Gluconobacter sp. P5B12]